MPEIFELYGKLVADTKDFTDALSRAETRLQNTGKEITSTETKARSFGTTTATQSRNFEKLNEKLGLAQARLTATATAFQKGEASAKQMASALMAVDRASNAVNSRLKDTEARLNDVRNKSVKLSSDVGGKSKAGLFGLSTSDLVSTATLYTGYRVLETAIDKTKEAENANRALTSSATEAGKAYSVLAKQALQFGKDASISNSEALKATAELQRLLTLAGKPGEFEKYSKGFLDVASARGVEFSELSTLFSGIISGSDDALNRFGKADPKKLGEDYAKTIGKTYDDLSDQEKILSRLVAFQKDFELFSGKNAERLKETSGEADNLSKSIDDVTTSFSLALTQSQLFREDLRLLSELFKAIAGYDPITVRIRLQQGESPRKLAEEANSGFWNDVWRGTKAVVSGIPAVGVLGYDLLTGNPNAWANYQGAVQPSMIYERDVDYTESELNKIKSGLKDQAQQAEIERQNQSPNTYLAWQKAQVEAFQKSSEKQQKIDDKAQKEYERKREQETEKLKRELEKRQKLLEDFNKYRASGQADLIENPFERIAAEGRIAANEAYNRFKELGPGYANQAAELERRKALKREQDELKSQIENVRSFAYSQTQNPYVALFENARQSIEKAREATRWLGKDIQDSVIKATQANNLNSLFNLRADTALSALSYRQKAEQILNPNRVVDEAQIIREQIYALQNANISEDVRNRRLADIYMSADPRNFPNEYRGMAYETLNKEAQRRIDEEKAGEKLFALFEKKFTNIGLKVDLGTQTPFQIEIKSSNLSVQGSVLPRR